MQAARLLLHQTGLLCCCSDAGSKPVPLTEDELGIMQGESTKATFKVGEEIKIIRGTFEGYSGKIYDISEDGASVTVLVNTGKRDMPVKVETSDIKLAD